MPAILGYKRGMRSNVVIAGEPQVNIVILAEAEFSIETRCGEEDISSVEDGSMHSHQIGSQKRRKRIPADLMVLIGREPNSFRIDPTVRAIYESSRWRAREAGETSGDGRGQKPIVRVKK
jgi:hypothetical protein